MKHTKSLLFSFALLTTCYVAYYSVQRNTLAPAQPLSTLTVMTTETDDFQKSFIVDVVNDLAHRMTQKSNVKTCSAERALSAVKRGKAQCAVIPKGLVEQEKTLLMIPLKDNSSEKVLVVSPDNSNLFKRAHATLLEMKEDGTINDFEHKWNLS